MGGGILVWTYAGLRQGAQTNNNVDIEIGRSSSKTLIVDFFYRSPLFAASTWLRCIVLRRAGMFEVLFVHRYSLTLSTHP